MDCSKLRKAGLSLLALSTTLTMATTFTGCSGGQGGSNASSTNSGPVSGVPGVPGSPPTSSRSYATDFMVFTGDGTWATEIPDAENLMSANGFTYQEVNSAELDQMTPAELADFGVLYFPGGEGSTQADSVSATTHSNLRTAVQSLGVGYVGFCAGAFIAVAPAPKNGGDVSYGFGVVNGALLNEYAGPGTNADYELTLESFPDGSTENILWYGGPVTPNTGVLAKYPTGDPAISEMWSGNGFVIIGGVHPDLSQGSLSSLGVSPDTSSQNIASEIFNAALKQQPLPTF